MNYMRPRLQRQTLMIMQGMDTVPFANKKVYFDKHTHPTHYVCSCSTVWHLPQSKLYQWN